MGRASRDKGARIEGALVAVALSHGFAAERVPLSGAARGRFAGDMSVPLLGIDCIGNRRVVPSAIVLGAGMVGVATAVHLHKRGWSVALVDHKEPGRETSYGNAGVIQSEALRPNPMPHDWHELANIATGRTNDVRYHLASLPYHIGPLFRYWWHSFPAAHARASAAYAKIIARAVREHEPLILESGAGNLVRRDGFGVLLHRDRAKFDAEAPTAEALRAAYGVKFTTMTAGELRQAEPALTEGGLGGLHWQEPWTVFGPGRAGVGLCRCFHAIGRPHFARRYRETRHIAVQRIRGRTIMRQRCPEGH